MYTLPNTGHATAQKLNHQLKQVEKLSHLATILTLKQTMKKFKRAREKKC